ncbi:MAG: M48 family metalloprotease [Gammaproteobacteria bacterium]|nr:M48 family metalloprotease [Gammaproteobacteria bacterium]MDE2251358.1 M48 family metalloprotease [Gammaproteobacteria bacterium]
MAGLLLTLGAVNAQAAGDPGAVAAQLPDMGSPENAVLSKADEYQIGLMAVRQLRSQDLILEDPELSDYIQQLGSRLAAQARDDDQNFQYFIIRSNEINAFATFGGFICVNSGLVLLTESESDLAAVLAHETAHVRQRHIARSILAESRMSLGTTAAMLAAVLIGAASGAGGQAMEGAIAMSQGIALQQSMNFTRGEEEEADRVGIGLLAGAGFNTMAMADFFESMGRREGLSELAGPLDMLRNHPVTRDRIAEARTRAAQFAKNPVNESILYPWMRERLRVLVAPADRDMTVYYAQLRDRRPLTDPERYGEALAQTRANQAGAAAVTLRTLRDRYPQITALYAALGQALQADHQSAAALGEFARAMALFPRNVPLSVRYADTLMQTGHASQAHALLLDVFNNTTPTPEEIRLTALAASAAGDAGDASYYMSEYHISNGDLALANQQLELALASPNLTSVQRQRFRARLDEIREWMREQRLARGGAQ